MGLTRRGRVLFSMTLLFALLSIVSFMTINVQTDWEFILQHRGKRLLAMLLVAIAMGLATIAFQTITHSRILTPSLMGFDVLYMLVHSVGLTLWGAKSGLDGAPELRFLLEVVTMVAIALILFQLLFNRSIRGLHVLILLGLVGGIFFRELAELALRITDPTEFSIQSANSLANFNRINLSLLWLGFSGVILCAAVLVILRRSLDVLSLGRDVVINLGVPYSKIVTLVMAAICVLISISTALVGPMLFFGLVVANLAYWLTGTHLHRWTFPTSILAGIICLVGGQVIFEQVLRSSLPLAMTIELVGGVLFIMLLLRGIKQ